MAFTQQIKDLVGNRKICVEGMMSSKFREDVAGPQIRPDKSVQMNYKHDWASEHKFRSYQRGETTWKTCELCVGKIMGRKTTNTLPFPQQNLHSQISTPEIEKSIPVSKNLQGSLKNQYNMG